MVIKFKVKEAYQQKLDLPAPKDAVSPDHEPKFLIKDFPENYILYHIHKNGTRQGTARAHNVVHASDLDPARKWCAREPALLTLHKKKRPSEFISTAQRMVWAMGYKGADLVMDMIPDEKLWGNWKCIACKQEEKYVYTPKKCSFCEADRRALRYQEVLLRDPKTGVVGSVDLFVDILGNGYKTALEIKTEGNDSFKSRKAPEFDHEWRTMLYLRLASVTWDGDFAKKHHINTESGRIIYVTKEGYADSEQLSKWKLGDWKKSAMQEYFVNRNDDMLDNQMDYAQSYRSWRNKYDDPIQDVSKLELPERVDTATSITCTRCKGCVVKKECWSDE